MKCKKCKRPWLYLGIISEFLSGFLYFAYGVYTHGHGRGVGPYGSTNMVHPGTTIPCKYK
jgi:hypothetical protein